MRDPFLNFRVAPQQNFGAHWCAGSKLAGYILADVFLSTVAQFPLENTMLYSALPEEARTLRSNHTLPPFLPYTFFLKAASKIEYCTSDRQCI